MALTHFRNAMTLMGTLNSSNFALRFFLWTNQSTLFWQRHTKKSEDAAKILGAPSISSLPSFSYAKFGEERMEEQKNIGWMEKVPKPTIGTKKGEIAQERDKEEEKRGGKSESVGANEENNAEGEEEGQRPEGRRRSTLSHRIFTICESETTLRNAKAAQSDEQMPTKRKVGPKERTAISSKDPIQFLSSDQRLFNRRLKERSEQRMQIMAYLGSDHVYDPSEEHLLWELRVANGRRLVTDWDLDKMRSVNSAKTGTMFRAQLTVKEPTLMDQIGEEEGQNNWEDNDGGRLAEEEEQRKGEGEEDGFEVPEGGDDYWKHWMIEIGRGVGFLHDNLRVEWAMELPEGCQYLSAQPLAGSADNSVQQQKDAQRMKGMTQRCAVKSVRRVCVRLRDKMASICAKVKEDVAQFGYPIEFTLNYGPPPTDPSEQRNVWPRILFTVTAEDNWGRIYIGGFAVLPLPVTFEPSPHHFWLDCVRPISPLSKIWALREAHLGQAEELARLKSLGEKMFNQEGIATEFGGKLEITIQNVHQSRHYISSDILRSLKYSTMMRRIGISEELQCRIAKVLAEFDRVRRQLIKVRKSQIVINK